MTLDFGAGQDEDLADEVVDIKPGLFLWRLLEHCPNASNHLACSMTFNDNTIQCRPRLLEIGRVVCQPPRGGIAVGNDGRQWLIDLVSDRS